MPSIAIRCSLVNAVARGWDASPAKRWRNFLRMISHSLGYGLSPRNPFDALKPSVLATLPDWLGSPGLPLATSKSPCLDPA